MISNCQKGLPAVRVSLWGKSSAKLNNNVSMGLKHFLHDGCFLLNSFHIHNHKKCVNTAKWFWFVQTILNTSWEIFLYTQCIKKPHSNKESKRKRSDIHILFSFLFWKALKIWERTIWAHLSVNRHFLHTFQLRFLNFIKYYLHSRCVLRVAFILAGDFFSENSEKMKLY